MPGIVTAVQNRASITSGKYRPITKPQLHRPRAPSVTCGYSSLPEGAMGCCVSTLDLWELEVPTVNPSVTATPCQLPLAREPLGCIDQSPPGHCGGASACRGGGIPWPKPRTSSLFPKKPSPFHMGLYLWEVPAVESLSHGCAVPAPFGKGAFGVHRPKPPLLKGGASACRGGGIPQAKPAELLTYSLFPIH